MSMIPSYYNYIESNSNVDNKKYPRNSRGYGRYAEDTLIDNLKKDSSRIPRTILNRLNVEDPNLVTIRKSDKYEDINQDIDVIFEHRSPETNELIASCPVSIKTMLSLEESQKFIGKDSKGKNLFKAFPAWHIDVKYSRIKRNDPENKKVDAWWKYGKSELYFIVKGGTYCIFDRQEMKEALQEWWITLTKEERKFYCYSWEETPYYSYKEKRTIVPSYSVNYSVGFPAKILKPLLLEVKEMSDEFITRLGEVTWTKVEDTLDSYLNPWF